MLGLFTLREESTQPIIAVMAVRPSYRELAAAQAKERAERLQKATEAAKAKWAAMSPEEAARVKAENLAEFKKRVERTWESLPKEERQRITAQREFFTPARRAAFDAHQNFFWKRAEEVALRQIAKGIGATADERRKFGQKIRRTRKQIGMRTQQDLADESGVNVGTVGRVERGDPTVSAETLAAVYMTLFVGMESAEEELFTHEREWLAETLDRLADGAGESQRAATTPEDDALQSEDKAYDPVRQTSKVQESPVPPFPGGGRHEPAVSGESGGARLEDLLADILAYLKGLDQEARSKAIRALTSLLTAIEHPRAAAATGTTPNDVGAGRGTGGGRGEGDRTRPAVDRPKGVARQRQQTADHPEHYPEAASGDWMEHDEDEE